MPNHVGPKDFRAIAIDPGGTTGYVIATKTGNKLKLIPGQEKMTPIMFSNFLQMHGRYPSWIICEDFEFRKGAREGLDLTPAHLIGVLLAFVGDSSDINVRRLYMQKASYAKSGHYNDAAQLKAKGVYIPGANYKHAMDAMRHFMQWFYFGPGYRFNDSPELFLATK